MEICILGTLDWTKGCKKPNFSYLLVQLVYGDSNLPRELRVDIEVNSHFLAGPEKYKQQSYMYTKDLRHCTAGHFLSFSTEQWCLPLYWITRGVGTQEGGHSIHTSRVLDKYTHPDLCKSLSNISSWITNTLGNFLIHNLFIVSTCYNSRSREHL